MIAPVQYAHVPPAHLLGGPSARCPRCHVVLRPGQPRAVQIEPSGAVRCVACPVRTAPPSRALLAVEPILRAAYAAAAGNTPLVRVYARAAAPYLGVLADTALVAVEAGIERSGVVTLAEGQRLEAALLRSEIASLRCELSDTRRELAETRALIRDAHDDGEAVLSGVVTRAA